MLHKIDLEPHYWLYRYEGRPVISIKLSRTKLHGINYLRLLCSCYNLRQLIVSYF